jgi:hypothetical protein
MELMIGTVHATAAPAPIRLSILRREIWDSFVSSMYPPFRSETAGPMQMRTGRGDAHIGFSERLSYGGDQSPDVRTIDHLNDLPSSISLPRTFG